MADRVALGAAGTPVLPPELASLIKGAIEQTFDTSRTVPVPDLQVGYDRLVQHLRLLDAFAMPEMPSMPPEVFVAKVYSDPQNPPPTLRPQDVDINGQDGGGVAVTYGGPPGGGSTSPGPSDERTKKGCGIAVAIIIAIDIIQAFVQCCVQWGRHETCTFWDNMILKKVWEQDPPDPRDPTHPQNPDVTASALTAIADSPQAAQLVWMLFDLHNHAWEAMAMAGEFLALTGLIYPGSRISVPLYAQFTSLPGNLPWPHRESPNSQDTYHFYPTTPLENPTQHASPFPPGVHPNEFLNRNGRLCATDVTLQLWRQIAAGEFDTQNLDLDADRGSGHPCWAARNSVQLDPVDVAILPYGEQ
jgi:hypothetical protein